MDAGIFCNSITFFTKRKYIYRYDADTYKVTKYELTDDEKESIKNFEYDPYDDLKAWCFLRDIWNSHEDFWGNERALLGRYRDYICR